MTGLQSFPRELCSLICRDPNLERLDLNSICFISHAFRNAAQRELSYRFPCVRGVNRVKAWCLSLQSRPHIALNVEGLVLLLPQPPALRVEHIEHLTQALHMCVNLKELTVLFQERRLRLPGMQERKYSSSTHMLNDHPFKLTKFVNGYFSQDNAEFRTFFRSQPCLESLELHSEKNTPKTDEDVLYHLTRPLKSLASPPQFLAFGGAYGMSQMRLRFDFENLMHFCEIKFLESLLRNHTNLTSLAIFSKQEHSHFSEIMSAIARCHIFIRHIEIHQFYPTQIKRCLPLSFKFDYWMITETLVFRPPPGLPKSKMAGDNPSLWQCAYVQLRTPIGRRRVANKLLTKNFPGLTRLVLVVHGKDYEFRRNLHSGIITEEILITRNTQEWASVK